MSYLIQTDEISLANQEKLRAMAVKAGKDRAFALRVATPGPGAPGSKEYYSTLVERDADYVTDFITWGAGAVALAGWGTLALAAVGTPYSVFADSTPVAVTPTVPNNTVVVFYKVSVLVTAGVIADPVSMLWFRTGAAANLKAQFDLEVLYSKLSADGYFTSPVVYDPQEIITATVEARVATAAICRVHLGSLVIEPIQVTLV